MTKLAEVEPISQNVYELAESPVWDETVSVLYWVDINRGTVHSWHPATGPTRRKATSPVGALALTDDHNQLLLASATGFELLDKRDGSIVSICEVMSGPSTRMNDGKVDSHGTFWAGTMSKSGIAGAGSLYRLAGATARTQLASVSISNGIAWSIDGLSMYYIDSPTKTVTSFKVDPEGNLMDKGSRLIDTAAFAGTPDGMCIDNEGCLWVCFWEGAAVRRFSPSGRLIRELFLPVSQPTSCAFGGEDMSQLFITTSRYALTPNQNKAEPLAGKILRMNTNTRGPHANRFRIDESLIKLRVREA